MDKGLWCLMIGSQWSREVGQNKEMTGMSKGWEGDTEGWLRAHAHVCVLNLKAMIKNQKLACVACRRPYDGVVAVKMDGHLNGSARSQLFETREKNEPERTEKEKTHWHCLVCCSSFFFLFFTLLVLYGHTQRVDMTLACQRKRDWCGRPHRSFIALISHRNQSFGV